MITTLEELLSFLKNSSDMENLNVGLTTYGNSWIVFKKKLTEAEKKAVDHISQKFELKDEIDFELADEQLDFLMDNLVYLGNDRCDMQKLVDFLKEINEVAEIKSIVTGVEFKLK